MARKKTQRKRGSKTAVVNAAQQANPDLVVPTLQMVDPEKFLAYLAKLETTLQASIDRYKSQRKALSTDIYNGQISYWTHQISTLRWLSSLIIVANG